MTKYDDDYDYSDEWREREENEREEIYRDLDEC